MSYVSQTYKKSGYCVLMSSSAASLSHKRYCSHHKAIYFICASSICADWLRRLQADFACHVCALPS